MDRRFDPAGPLRGTLRPPADKSISHRAALIGAMSEGETRIEGYLDAADTRSTLAAVEVLGAKVEAGPKSQDSHPQSLDVRVEGVGLRGASGAEIDVGNAGTLLRILPGWLAGQEGKEWTLDGDASIRRRPVDRVAKPLREMGAPVECRDGRFPPLRVAGAGLTGIEYRLPVASAQVKSCVLLAGLLAEGETTVIEPSPTRDHTERMLAVSGARLETTGGRITIRPAEGLESQRFEIPGDISSAAFPLLAALLVAESEIELTSVGLNPTRTGLLTILGRMGAQLEVDETAPAGHEPRGTIRAVASRLAGTEVGGDEVPLAIDELPLVALAACFAEGETVIRDAAELRHKESDRIAAVCDGLAALGGDVEPTEDGMVVRGGGGLGGGTLDARGDHRLAMLGAVAGLASNEGVTIRGFEAAEVSYPGFERDLATLSG
ncbi:MAG: 3-phosphoshikimate 1-carboxyvinyltransferase [Actinomycetota bacterium]|nr:3-phosphoshikimate 1-carboxyvinyltransferase [Actinomycetota bacterium]